MQYQALFEPDTRRGGYVVTFPDFPRGVTRGETETEALSMAADAHTMVIAHYMASGRICRLPEFIEERSFARSVYLRRFRLRSNSIAGPVGSRK